MGIDHTITPQYAILLSEGLVGVRNDKDSHAAYLHWACTAPHNNKYEFGSQKYVGVGGHLFAIAADKSMKWGHEGTSQKIIGGVSL